MENLSRHESYIEHAYVSDQLFHSSLPGALMDTKLSNQRLWPSITLSTPWTHAYLLLIFLPFFLTYSGTWILYQVRHRSARAVKIPPTIPYAIPFLGSALDFAYNGLKFISSNTWRRGEQTPFGINIMNQTMFVVTGAENINALWKKSGTVAGPAIQAFCLKFLFGMPDNATKMYILDKSGISTKPHPESAVAPHNRVDYLTHVGLKKFLCGNRLTGFYRRWQAGFNERLKEMNIDEDWVEMPDLMEFWENTFGIAVLEAYTGPILRCVNPDLLSDLRLYDGYIPDLSRGLPKWMNRKAYAVRDKLTKSVMQWHAIARARFNESLIDADGDADPYWGSAFIRERQEIFNGIDNFDYKAHAASDLGFIWAANTNLVPTTMWEIYATFQDKTVLTRVRSELEATFDRESLVQSIFDTEKFKDLHILQSIYAETLRLRVYAYAARYTEEEELQIKQWLFPKKSALVIPTVPAHMDETFWNTRNGRYPVDKFWSDRFLVSTDDPESGPWKRAAAERAVCKNDLGPRSPTFTTAGTNGSWIPYGGGPRACPGRYFAKRAMIAAAATVVMHFDIEFCVEPNSPALDLDPKFYGWGGQRPVGAIPFRIRRRAESCLGPRSRI